jgi:hypothetical protein
VRPSITESPPSSIVSMITGTSPISGAPFIRLHVSIPPIPGIMQSSRMQSTSCAASTSILLGFMHALGGKPNRTQEEEEFLVTMYETWDDARKQGREQGRVETRADAVLTVLRVRGLPVTDDARERILAEKDPDRLERWLERACVSASITEVLDEPS